METKRNKGMGIAAFVLGIIGLLLSCIVVGVVLDVLALILGIASLSDKTSKNGFAIAGICTGAAGVLIALIMLVSIAGDTGEESNESPKESIESQEVLKNEAENEEESGEPEIAEIEEPKVEIESEEIEEPEIETEIETEIESEEGEEPSYIKVGDSFEKDGLKITINEASTDFQDYENEYGWNTPKVGKKYVMVSFTFENNGNSDAYASIYDFTCYADNTTCEQIYSLDDSGFMNTNLSPGRNVSFKTYYAVPIDSQSIELEYEMNAWTGEKAVIKIQ